MLKYFWQNRPSLGHFIPRKNMPQGPFALVVGAVGAGKTAVLLNWLEMAKNGDLSGAGGVISGVTGGAGNGVAGGPQNTTNELADEELLYINLADIRVFDPFLAVSELADFVIQNRIKAVAVDGADRQILAPLLMAIKRLKSAGVFVAVASKEADINIDGLKKTHLFGLDFEEFIAFSRKSYEPRTLFGQFLECGNSPACALGHGKNIDKIAALWGKKAAQLLTCIASSIHQPLNTHRLYLALKNGGIAVSKTWVYDMLKTFLNSGIIAQTAPTHGQKPRIYMGDFGLLDQLLAYKDLKKKITNVVFCELLKNGSVGAADGVDFVQGKCAIWVVPFVVPEVIMTKARPISKDLALSGIKRLVIISNAGELTGVAWGVKIEIVPFWRWAVE